MLETVDVFNSKRMSDNYFNYSLKEASSKLETPLILTYNAFTTQ